MASGFSRRMEKNKLILDLGGMPVIERVIKSVKESKVDNIIMVYRDDNVKKIGIRNGIECIYNDKAEYGQSQSIKLGIQHSPKGTSGFMFLVGDQPFLNADTINTLIGVFKEKKYPIIVPEYKGKRGNPVVFSAKLKNELLNIDGDNGGRSIVRKRHEDVRVVHFSDSIVGQDIDTWEEYIRWRCE